MQLDGVAVRSRLTLAAQAEGCAVARIEGLSGMGALGALEDAFHRHNAVQCGCCKPGMPITAAEQVESGAAPDRTAIREHSGKDCRCTSYPAIVDGVATVLSARETAKGRQRRA